MLGCELGSVDALGLRAAGSREDHHRDPQHGGARGPSTAERTVLRSGTSGAARIGSSPGHDGAWVELQSVVVEGVSQTTAPGDELLVDVARVRALVPVKVDVVLDVLPGQFLQRGRLASSRSRLRWATPPRAPSVGGRDRVRRTTGARWPREHEVSKDALNDALADPMIVSDAAVGDPWNRARRAPG